MNSVFKREKPYLLSLLVYALMLMGCTTLEGLVLNPSYAVQTNGTNISSEGVSSLKYKWKINELYPNQKALEADLQEMRTVWLPKLASYQGQLSKPQILRDYLLVVEQVQRMLSKASTYVALKGDLMQGQSETDELMALVDDLYFEYAGIVYHSTEELRSMSEESYAALVSDPELTEFKRYLDKLAIRLRHDLNAYDDIQLAQMNINRGEPKMVFDRLTTAQYIYPVIQSANGKKITLTASVYDACETSRDRVLRKAAYEAVMASFEKQIGSLAENYANQLNNDNFSASASHYNSALEAALFSEELSKESYDCLVSTVTNNLKPLHKYYELRRNDLGLDKMYSYDVLVPMVEDIRFKMNYDPTMKMINQALAPLGIMYQRDFNVGINDNWIDAYPEKSKLRSNYMRAVYDLHPFILLNYNNSLGDALTVNRLMGAAMNSFYSSQSQRFIYADVPKSTEDVAAYVNEILLMQYLIDHAKTDDEKLYFINWQIQSIKEILFNRTLAAEFEQNAHEMAALKGQLSVEDLNDLWLALLQKYGGNALIIPDTGKYTWSRMKQFYTPFESYKAAYNLSAAYCIVDRLKGAESQTASEHYLMYLSSGGSRSPIESLKLAGVDMNTPEPTERLVKYFESLVDEYEKLLKAKKAAGK